MQRAVHSKGTLVTVAASRGVELEPNSGDPPTVVARTEDPPLKEVFAFVSNLDKQVNNTSARLAMGFLAFMGLALVVLPVIGVFTVGSARFPDADYLVTSIIGAILTIASVAGLVLDSRGRARDVKAWTNAGADFVVRERQARAQEAAALEAALAAAGA